VCSLTVTRISFTLRESQLCSLVVVIAAICDNAVLVWNFKDELLAWLVKRCRVVVLIADG
jgi:hypothetical protein